jgi:predicted dehydrogenase
MLKALQSLKSEVPMGEDVNRRKFVKTAAGVSAALGAFTKMVRPAQARVIGANDRINLGIVGLGGRGNFLARQFADLAEKQNLQIATIAEVYEKRKRQAAERWKAKGTLDYREIINDKSIDAVVIATPDHWHAPVAIQAMNAGKDVYLEKPMTRTVDEAKEVYETSVKTKRILQIGSQTTSADQWWKARKAIQDGMIGKMILSQGSYHRNWNGKQQPPGEWNWPIEPEAGPDAGGENYVDWKMWVGNSPRIPWNADRFFRFRKYWDYSGGIATDLFYHVMAPLNLCWGGGEFPYRVCGTGGIYVFKDEREVPDTFMLVADYPSGHSVVLSSSMANSRHIPGLIRGYEGTIVMVEHGMFEGRTDYITVTPERHVAEAFKKKYGSDEVKITVEPRPSHYENFIVCMRAREKPVLDGLTAFKAMVPIAMSVESYRTGQMLFFDEKTQKVTTRPPKKA